MMNLLITGGAGFIGSSLIRHVIDRSEITKLVNLDCLTYAGHLENLDGIHGIHPRYLFEQVDLRDKVEVLRVIRQHDITHVMHLAAESHVDRSITGPGDFITTNINGTFHLLEACRAHWFDQASGIQNGASKFLHVSTDEVFGSLGPHDPAFTETSACTPNSPYSASKAASDMLVRSYHHTYDLPAVTTRCSNNYGPYQFPEKLIPVVIQSVLAREPVPIYGDGMNVRDWLYVGDHCEALWSVLTSGKVGETYNIGGRSELANVHLVQMICDLIDELKPELGGHSRSLLGFVPDRPGHDRRYAMDATKISVELGWNPAHTLETGLRETVVWYLQHQGWVESIARG
ncbi:MAG: dTDP-glucose 4,6-dehydratase [Prosthecobacter sp.]|uniref:dTDP-glucose 4,6-dehydratase n=1 Tax=Prosthecobacter sp. TaxID=1965333 RepID=UPI0025DEF4A9|nr:dTDP-glucose 4,6-dehydratase [Prosthecobacter sp.]MCF7785930.1 dTDP-glucose 4,6-dehydratase [Prosthecobacter sp.]